MFKNYLITAWRNIVKDKFYTLLNILGLAIGLTAAIFIFLYVVDELTYDQSHVNYKRIYRLESHFVINGKDDLFAATQVPLGPTLKDEFPEIEEYVRFAPTGTLFFKYDDREFQEDSIVYADSTLFRVFTHPVLKGDPNTMLNRPYTIVMTESMAKKYFGKEDPIGKSIRSVEGNNYEVSGVIADLPGNLHLRFNGVLSVATIRQQIGVERFNDRSAGAFWNVGIFTYIMLKEGSTIQPILDKFPGFYTKYMKSLGDQINASFTLMAKPLSKVHHHSSDLGYDQPGGNIKYVIIFSLVAILIVIIACINYMNLATARSSRRNKETGMRKISGAQRHMLIRQFLIESWVIVVLSVLLSFLFSWLLLPYFNLITNKTLTLSVIFTPTIISYIVGLALIVGLVSGSYPAVYLSSFNPASVIKGTGDIRGGSGLLRKILVVFQFGISVAMITGTFIVGSQLNYMQSSDPGFNKDNLVVMEMRDTTFKKGLDAFKQELLKNPDVKGIAFSNGNPGYDININVMRIEGDSGMMVDRAVNNFFADYDYASLMGLKMVEGRYYNREMKTDPQKAFVINETAARKFGWVDSTSRTEGNYASAIGKKFQWGINPNGDPPVRDGVIVGVVKDFHYGSMRNPIEPLVILLDDNNRNAFFANIRIDDNHKQKTIDFINQTRQEFKDLYPFKYSFIDAKMKDYYSGEKRISMLARTFAILTIIIAALGLFGLSSFLTQTRTREIGIRKISGASASNIVLMFAREFAGWILLANVIAAPVTILLLKKWLEAFPYKTAIHSTVFIAGLAITLAIALITVGFRVIQAASTNPAEAIRYS
jgi:putative ABC transport system permease protein